ncbi:interleukin-1 receptor accessory protein isoform X1 [Sardina pilchardus]|uniref:interleukin-1 receptor accessory protein isoform X1 n=1 Tax=Sardina pilchardus TaxID=27697 RepID=UPI002E121C03
MGILRQPPILPTRLKRISYIAMIVVVALIISLLSFAVVIGEGEATEAATQVNNHSESQCLDWGEVEQPVAVQEGEVGWLRCPLHHNVYNYSATQASGLTLLWYRKAAGQSQEEPIKLKQYPKDREWLWLEPATQQDSGKYTCMLSNKTFCIRVSMRLEVIPPGAGCVEQVVVAPKEVRIPLMGMKTFSCPDVDMVQHRHLSYTTTWYHKSQQKCKTIKELGRQYMQAEGDSVTVYSMFEFFQGNYACVVSYDKAGRHVNFTRVIHAVAVSNDKVRKEPTILNPAEGQDYAVTKGEPAALTCRALLPYIETEAGETETQDLWWTVDGKRIENVGDQRYNVTSRIVLEELKDETRETVLHIRDFKGEDLHKEFRCSARNSRGNATSQAILKEEVGKPYVELICGLATIVIIMVSMLVIYQVFWLELLLLYRSHFGSDERSTDDKEYDVYISYARQSEEEEFVIKTLRKVLENELGYTVCIFDRDSLPGGTITDETLSFVNACRRQIVVVSPEREVKGTQAMLELRAGLDRMVSGGGLRVILVQYKRISRDSWVRELKRARGVLALVRWEGERSQDLSSRFWKRLQVELPVRRVKESPSSLPLESVVTTTAEESSVPLKSKEAVRRIGALSCLKA